MHRLPVRGTGRRETMSDTEEEETYGRVDHRRGPEEHTRILGWAGARVGDVPFLTMFFIPPPVYNIF